MSNSQPSTQSAAERRSAEAVVRTFIAKTSKQISLKSAGPTSAKSAYIEAASKCQDTGAMYFTVCTSRCPRIRIHESAATVAHPVE